MAIMDNLISERRTRAYYAQSDSEFTKTQIDNERHDRESYSLKEKGLEAYWENGKLRMRRIKY